MSFASRQGPGRGTQESDFLTRQHGHQRRHAKELHQLTKDVAKDQTFEPAINPKSKALPARGPADFVFKDVERLEKKKAKLVKYYTERPGRVAWCGAMEGFA